MLRGEKVALRARISADVPILHAELQDDVETRSRSDSRPWQPVSPDSESAPFRVAEPEPDAAVFSIVELASAELAGACVLWGISLHNRSAHLGLSLIPAFRGRGLGVDVVQVLCRYAFRTRGLHRLQVDTLADNHAMLHAAQRVGFQVEATLRQAAWFDGGYVDEVVLGLLVEEWTGG